MTDQTTSNATTGNPTSKDMDALLHSFMGFLQEQYQQSANNAGDSKGMLNMGMKDQFAQEWEGFINNPIGTIYEMRKGMDESLRQFINMLVSTYLKRTKRDLISSVLLAASDNNALYYCISLKEDSLSNRISINEFFDFYEENDMSTNFPVYFHFIPEASMPNIKYLQKIA
jgi:hypothetical protein